MKGKDSDADGRCNPNRFKELFTGVVNSLFYSECIHCDNILKEFVSKGLCRDCWNTIPSIQPPMCVLCGIPFQENLTKESLPHRCSDCIENPPAYDSVRSYGAYRGKLKDGIHSFKYDGNKAAGKELGKLLYITFSRYTKFGGVDFITFAPLHHKRKKERGFDQASILGKELSDRTGLSFKRFLRRIKNTKPQTELTKAQRKKNVRGAFSPVNKRKLEGRDLLIVDDVYTTGATLRECSKELKEAGAEKILVLTVARVE